MYSSRGIQERWKTFVKQDPRAMRIAPPTEEEILRAQVSSYKKIQSDGYPLSREEKDVIANFETNLNELQAKNVKKVRVLIRDDKKLAMKKDKDKLK